MKELEQHFKKGDKTVIVKQTNKEIQLVLNGVIKPKRGHTLFSINRLTLEVKEAEYISQAIDFKDAANGIITPKSKLVCEPDCIYIPALNKDNAIKKYRKNQNQSAYFKSDLTISITDHFI